MSDNLQQELDKLKKLVKVIEAEKDLAETKSGRMVDIVALHERYLKLVEKLLERSNCNY